MGIRSLGYVDWQSTDAESWREFGTEVLGMQLNDGPDGVVDLRIDDRAHRLRITQGDEPQVTLGFEVVDDVDLEATVKSLADAGVAVESASDDDAAQKSVTGLARFRTPEGIPVELYHGPVLLHDRPNTPLVSRFVTGDMGMGHAVIATDKPAETVELFRSTLGFHLRNTMRMQMPDPYGNPTSTMHFLGCNPRHHTLGVVPMSFPGNLAHIMLEVGELDDVGRAYDRVHDREVPIAMTLGRHTNDHMVSFYCVAPDGTMIEFGWGGLEVPEPETTYEITEVSFWGHRPPSH